MQFAHSSTHVLASPQASANERVTPRRLSAKSFVASHPARHRLDCLPQIEILGRGMAPADLDHFRWLYGAEPGDLAGIAERFEEELVINQSPEMPGTAGTFHGYEGLAAVNAEISESYAEVL